MEAFKLILLLCLSSICESANILYVVPFTSKSHYIMLRPIGLELARRGHNVTVITAYREENHPPNYRQVMVDDKLIWDVLGIERPNVFDMVSISAEEFHKLILWGGGLGVTEMVLNSTEVREFLTEKNSFDLVISEQFFQESMYLLAHKYKTPLVLVTTYGNCMRHNIVQRNPLQLATSLAEFLDVKEPTSFLGRLRNLYFITYEFIMWKYSYLEKQEALVKKYIKNLPEPVPSLYEMQKSASLILLNSHFSFDPPVAYLPNIVPIGGIHLSRSDSKLPDDSPCPKHENPEPQPTKAKGHFVLPKKPLPEIEPGNCEGRILTDLQKLLDEESHGVVYVNFGSNVRSSELPVEKRAAFLDVFKNLKHKVLWKWEDDNLPNKPDNLVVRSWFPQKEILSHPNIKVFISHGGLIGTQEAIFHGVPIIGMPIYADQYNNLLQVEHLGFGRILKYNDINERSLQNILNVVLSNDTYKQNAKEVSARFKDRPISAMDTAMFWIEYVMRHKGASFMKNPALDLSWIAYNMIDVYAFIAVGFLLTAYVLYKALYKIIGFVKSSNTSKRNVKKRQ